MRDSVKSIAVFRVREFRACFLLAVWILNKLHLKWLAIAATTCMLIEAGAKSVQTHTATERVDAKVILIHFMFRPPRDWGRRGESFTRSNIIEVKPIGYLIELKIWWTNLIPYSILNRSWAILHLSYVNGTVADDSYPYRNSISNHVYHMTFKCNLQKAEWDALKPELWECNSWHYWRDYASRTTGMIEASCFIKTTLRSKKTKSEGSRTVFFIALK